MDAITLIAVVAVVQPVHDLHRFPPAAICVAAVDCCEARITYLEARQKLDSHLWWEYDAALGDARRRRWCWLTLLYCWGAPKDDDRRHWWRTEPTLSELDELRRLIGPKAWGAGTMPALQWDHERSGGDNG